MIHRSEHQPDPRDPGRDLSQQLKGLAEQRKINERKPGDVATGVRVRRRAVPTRRQGPGQERSDVGFPGIGLRHEATSACRGAVANARRLAACRAGGGRRQAYCMKRRLMRRLCAGVAAGDADSARCIPANGKCFEKAKTKAEIAGGKARQGKASDNTAERDVTRATRSRSYPTSPARRWNKGRRPRPYASLRLSIPNNIRRKLYRSQLNRATPGAARLMVAIWSR